MSKNILIIDCQESTRETAAITLGTAGFDVVMAGNGGEGLALAVAIIPDLVICEVLMPEMDGYEVFIALKQNKLTKHIPFIFTLNESGNVARQKAIFGGIENFLVKPITDSDLLACVKTSLNHI